MHLQNQLQKSAEMTHVHAEAVKNIKNAVVLTNNESYQKEHAAKAACSFFITAFTRKFIENKLQLLYNYKHKEYQRRRHMNKKPVQIFVMILIAIMFIATIVITIVWKPSPDNTSASVIASGISEIAMTGSSAL